MRKTLTFATALLSVGAFAQFSEIGAMTEPHSHIDVALMAPGPTSVAAINAIGTGSGGNIVSITGTPSGAAAGIYDTNPGYGNAIGFVSGVLSVVAPGGAFDGVWYDITLGMMSTQFGFSFGDWSGPAIVQFYDGATQIGADFMTTASFGAALNSIFVESTIAFDRVVLQSSVPTVGNMVVPDLYVQVVPEPGTFIAIGIGLAGLALARRRK